MLSKTKLKSKHGESVHVKRKSGNCFAKERKQQKRLIATCKKVLENLVPKEIFEKLIKFSPPSEHKHSVFSNEYELQMEGFVCEDPAVSAAVNTLSSFFRYMEQSSDGCVSIEDAAQVFKNTYPKVNVSPGNERGLYIDFGRHKLFRAPFEEVGTDNLNCVHKRIPYNLVYFSERYETRYTIPWDGTMTNMIYVRFDKNWRVVECRAVCSEESDRRQSTDKVVCRLWRTIHKKFEVPCSRIDDEIKRIKDGRKQWINDAKIMRIYYV
jgi:hypothetical protein